IEGHTMLRHATFLAVFALGSMLLPTGASAFAFQQTLVSTPPGPWDLALDDVSGDGKPDLVVTNYVANSLSVRFGNGAGGFGPETVYATQANPVSVAVGDIDE